MKGSSKAVGHESWPQVGKMCAKDPSVSGDRTYGPGNDTTWVKYRRLECCQ